MYALLDCNNFFASCERVFNPTLQDTAVVVLSNNDGCIVARSNEVKKMGVPMGAPYFKWRKMLDRFGVHVCSSNFTLYGDMSRRVMEILREYSFVDTVYSVDEAFLDFTGLPDAEAHARQLRAQILQWTGIPVSIGIGPTKTLAKLTNEFAKKNPEYGGVLSMEEPGISEKLHALPVGEVWGIGRGLTKKLGHMGIATVGELLAASPSHLRSLFGVGIERTTLELSGTSCEKLTESKDVRKSIIRSRSFRKKVMDKQSIREAISTHVMTASKKLRSLGLGAQHMAIYFRSSPHAKTERYSAVGEHTFLTPVNNTFMLTKEALRMVEEVYRPHIRYAKAGVVMIGLAPIDVVQCNLFEDVDTEERSHEIFTTLDAINKRFGNDTLRLGAMGLKQDWSMKKEWRSNKYTSEWGDLIRVT